MEEVICAEGYFSLANVPEVTMVLSGKVKMFGKVWTDGDIVTILPGEITAFEALTDAVTVVLKVPGVLNDKYEI